jgi:hypothetical protein
MADRPIFEPATGDCQVLKCVNPAKYWACWPHTSKLVCENHKNEVKDKRWPDVAKLFGSTRLK